MYDTIKNVGLSSPLIQKTYTLGESDINNAKTYVAVGDSLTAGTGVSRYEESYVYLLAQKLSVHNKINLHVEALSGATATHVTELLLDPTIKKNPDIVTILIGINDVHGIVSKQEFAVQYKKILERLTQETDAEIYSIAISYMGDKSLILPPYRVYFDKRIRDFNTVIQELSQEYNVKYVDVYTPTKKASLQREYYSEDLFHPSALAYSLWAQLIYDTFNN
jgi:lysophospholipase L1-like esterase